MHIAVTTSSDSNLCSCFCFDWISHLSPRDEVKLTLHCSLSVYRWSIIPWLSMRIVVITFTIEAASLGSLWVGKFHQFFCLRVLLVKGVFTFTFGVCGSPASSPDYMNLLLRILGTYHGLSLQCTQMLNTSCSGPWPRCMVLSVVLFRQTVVILDGGHVIDWLYLIQIQPPNVWWW